MLAIRFVLGFIIMVTGRQAYALFVGGVGFILGVLLSSKISLVQSNWNYIALPLFMGFFCGLSVYVLKRWVARAAAFIAGGYLLQNLPGLLGSDVVFESWVSFVIAGVVVSVALFLWFELSLVVLSSFLGVTFIFQAVSFGSLEPSVMFFLLVFFGVITQLVLLQYGEPTPD